MDVNENSSKKSAQDFTDQSSAKESKLLANKLRFFAENIIKLLDQSGYWATVRIDLKLDGKHDEARRIEEVYLKPLDRKINAFVERGLLEL